MQSDEEGPNKTKTNLRDRREYTSRHSLNLDCNAILFKKLGVLFRVDIAVMRYHEISCPKASW